MHALSVGLLAAALALYATGVVRLWRRAGPGRGIAPRQACWFSLGWLAIALALVSPLHHLAERLLWAHMVQHELLMVVAAPLLALGRPLEAWSWVLPIRVPRLLGDPLFAWALHAATLWAWHLPLLFEAATGNDALHLAQHASFLVPAAIFWWAVLGPRAKPLAALLALFTTMLHTGALGALMAFSAAPWYAAYALPDQQLAGLVMWIPGGSVYPLAALALMASALHRSARH